MVTAAVIPMTPLYETEDFSFSSFKSVNVWRFHLGDNKWHFIPSRAKKIWNESDKIGRHHFKVGRGDNEIQEEFIEMRGVTRLFRRRETIFFKFWGKMLYIVDWASGIEEEFDIGVSLLLKSERTQEQKKVNYVKIRSIGIGDNQEPSFVEEDKEPRVLIPRKRPGDFLEILITDIDLVVTHKLTIMGLCGYLEASRVAVRSLPLLMGKSKLVLSVFKRYGRESEHSGRKYIFLFDLVDLSLSRFNRAKKSLGEGLMKGQHSLVAEDDDFVVSLFGPNFVMLDDYVYQFDDE